MGGSLVGADFFPFGTQDFGPAFSKIKDANPDIVWFHVRRLRLDYLGQAIPQLRHEAGADLSRLGRRPISRAVTPG